MVGPLIVGLRRLSVICIGLLALVYLSGSSRVSYAQDAHPPHCPADTLVVMGAAQYDGTPSPVFARRLDRALELYRAGCAPRILVTGGKQLGDRFTEGGTGVRYLTEHGVPQTALLGERKSRSSYQNLHFSEPLLRGQRILIVTDDLHAYRTRLLARHLGLDAAVAPVTTHGPRLPYLLREAAGVTAYLLGVYR